MNGLGPRDHSESLVNQMLSWPLSERMNVLQMTLSAETYSGPAASV